MKKLIRDAFFLGACSLALNACDEESKKETTKTKTTLEDKHEHPKVTEVNLKSFNKYCPVTGGIITANAMKGETAELNGKTYAFCCAGCITSFKSNPEKYTVNLSEDGQEWTSSKKQQEM